MNKIVANSAPLISLSRIGLLDILQKLYGVIYIPDAVYKEIVIKGINKPGSEEIKNAHWIKRISVKDKKTVLLLLDELGEGESEVIVLAEEINADFVLIDERPATIKLQMLNIERLGTLGILLLAKEKKYIENIKPYLDFLIDKEFRIDDKLYKYILHLAKE